MLGLQKDDVKRIINDRIESNPDLKYYLNDEYVTILVDLLIEGISEAMVANNKKIADELKKRSRI